MALGDYSDLDDSDDAEVATGTEHGNDAGGRPPPNSGDPFAQDLLEWLGAAACRLKPLLAGAPVDTFVRAVRLPRHGALPLSSTDGAFDARRWSGLLPCSFVDAVAGQARACARMSGAPWAALTVWASRDALKAWQARSSRAGDARSAPGEVRSLVVFSDSDEAWLLRA